MRLSTSDSEFSKALLATINEVQQFIIWKSFEDHRVLSKSSLEGLEQKKDEIFLNFSIDQDLSESDKIFYFYNETSLILFKAELIDLKSDKIKVKVLDKRYLAEKRSNKRIQFNNLVLKVEIKTKEAKNKSRTHAVTISDISDSGVSFTIPKSQTLLFEKGKSVSLTKIEKIELPQGIDGSVVHSTRLESESSDSGNIEYMVGVKFEAPSALLKAVIDEVRAS